MHISVYQAESFHSRSSIGFETPPSCPSRPCGGLVELSDDHAEERLTEEDLKNRSNELYSTSKRNRRVRFQDPVTNHHTLSLDKYTDAEVTCCWYSKRDFRHMRKYCAKIIKFLDKYGTKVQIKGDSFRGLESYTKEASENQARNLRAAYDSVFRRPTKEMRWSSTNIHDAPSTIAGRYHAASSLPRMWAMCVARQDEAEARSIYDEPSTNSAANALAATLPGRSRSYP